MTEQQHRNTTKWTAVMLDFPDKGVFIPARKVQSKRYRSRPN